MHHAFAEALPLAATDPRWLAIACGDLAAVHRDHLHCERKAAQSALSLMRSYPDHGPLVAAMARLAHEETKHVVQVASLLARTHATPGFDHGDDYAASLRALTRKPEPARLLDRLLVFAIIEGRSAERLALLAGALPDAADRMLYANLAAAELRHRDTFLELATTAAPADAFRARAAELAAAEAAILAARPMTARIH
jgi:tRNA-(ms[2]io[6]A)-hydroxylase